MPEARGKNILMVVSSLKIGGGAERSATLLGKSLCERGHQVTYLTFYEERPACEYQGENICLGYKKNKNPLSDAFEILATARKIRDICRERDIDVLISFLTRMNVQSLLSKTLFGNKVRMLVSVRNNPLEGDKRWHRSLMKYLYPKAHKVVVQTDAIGNILNDRLSINNTTVIHNMADSGAFRELSNENILRKHERVFDNDFTFITIGSLTKQKGHWHLIRAFKGVSEDTKLVVLGKGPLENCLKGLVRDVGIEDRIFFLGEVRNIFPYLKAADCFVLTSIFEGYPNVLIEALSQDMPVISTDCISGPREILCPELSPNAKIEYPYMGRYGILTKPFVAETGFRTLNDRGLTREETMLGRLMAQVKVNEKIRDRYSDTSVRVKDFDRLTVVRKWEELL